MAGAADRTRHGSPAFEVIFLLVLAIAGFLPGQSGIPVEDGGEAITVARLGGTMHPPGMPLLALLLRVSWLAGEAGPVILMALCSAFSLWLLFRRAGAAGLAMALAVLSMPAFRARVLAWDAYGPLFLLFSIALSMRTASAPLTGYLTGLALSVHPWGVLLPAASGIRRHGIATAAVFLIAGASLYLALPVMSAAGCAVDWGTPGDLEGFVRQVSASGYREVYGASMGRFSPEALSRHLGTVGGMLWPAFCLPVAIGAVSLFRSRGRELAALLALAALDLLLVVFINPMASGTSQTAWLTLLAFCGLASASLRRLPTVASLLISAAVASASLAERADPLPDQEPEIRRLLGSAPLESGFFLSDNDLLYGCWMEKYARDLRPDVVLLSTGNFSPWFERLARRYNPDLDTSGGLYEAGGPGTPREVLVARLMEMTIRNNPQREFFTDL